MGSSVVRRLPQTRSKDPRVTEAFKSASAATKIEAACAVIHFDP
jgi:hypothetical protein